MHGREISHFTTEEAFVIERLFRTSGIRFTKRTLHLGATLHRGIHAYTFVVPDEQFDSAIAMLKDWMGLGAGPGLYTGECPACGAWLEYEARCTECDLNLSGDYSDVEPSHPFVAYLQHEGLL